MWDPQHLTILRASMAYYRGSFTLLFYLYYILLITFHQNPFSNIFILEMVRTSMLHIHFVHFIKEHHVSCQWEGNSGIWGCKNALVSLEHVCDSQKVKVFCTHTCARSHARTHIHSTCKNVSYKTVIKAYYCKTMEIQK
jgi:hypothetical protein